ncbi:MAG: N-6 DNA methylase [Nitrospinae bacterium]|nr:N-6 DNA methylase [Nitrospinota bacterium]
MPIQENALNSALAEALSAHDLHTSPEQTRVTSGAKRCDVQIRRLHGDRYFTALECKIGQSKTQRQAAVKDAQRWLKQAECWNAIALCYPEEISEDRPLTPRQLIEDADDLLMVRVNRGGTIGHWRKGRLSALAILADDIGANETYAVTDILQRAIITASEQINMATGQDLAETLELPWALTKSGIDPRPARIACLIVANMALLQNRMQSEGIHISGLDTLLAVRTVPNKQKALLDNWQRIRDVDYAPVVDPALAVLHKLPTDHHTDNLLEILIEAVLDCAPRIRGLQLDHAGPLYHGLLETARYDGSFYTSTAAAVLLAELAMPPDWSLVEDSWTNADRLINLKVCDPACGTGTLLMAAARTIEERYRSAGGDDDDLSALHLSLIEDVLHGFDINRHAIHLAASMLTLSAPKIDYNKMNLYNMQHGINANGDVRAGSLDILANNAGYLPGLAPDTSQKRTTASGYQEDSPSVEGLCDLVIMNPPFTRNDIRNRHLPPEVRREVQQHEIYLAEKTPDKAHRNAIDQAAIRTFFSPIADILLREQGTLAIVVPFTACTGAGGKGERNLLTDPERFHLELVVTSHDNRRIYFSENTDIHESLIVARRPTPESRGKPTAFVSLAENPASASEAHFLAEAIRQARYGDYSLLANYGTIAWRSLEQLRDRPWNAACFYDQSLADAYDLLFDIPGITAIGELAAVEPGGQRIRDAFNKAANRQSPDMRALWAHKSERQTTMRTGPDEFLVAKKGMHDYAQHLWRKRSYLLLANRMRLNLTQTPAVFSIEPVLGSAFIPVSPAGDNKEQLCKAWCVWLNSTFGIVAFLNSRQKNLTYPNFSLKGLRSLPVPRPSHCDIALLSAIYEQYSVDELRPLPEIHADPIRHALDDAVLKAVPGLPGSDVARWRQSISLEPSVNNEKDPFRLN